MPTNSHTDYLVSVAKQYWSDGEPCPVDIIFNLAAQGVDAHELELEYHNSKSDEYLRAISDDADNINPDNGVVDYE